MYTGILGSDQRKTLFKGDSDSSTPNTAAQVSKIQRDWGVEASPREFPEETSSG